MCKLYFEEYVFIVIKSLIISFIVCLLMFLMFNVIEFNFSVAFPHDTESVLMANRGGHTLMLQKQAKVSSVVLNSLP